MIGFVAFLFIGFTVINRICEGAFVDAADVGIINNVLIFKEVSVFNLFTLPVPNLSYITQGIPHLIKWDYSFFGGNAALIQYMLYSITAAISFLLFTLIIGLLYQYFGRAR
jgi:hypothetical protein